jgi:hypothetical protein
MYLLLVISTHLLLLGSTYTVPHAPAREIRSINEAVLE